MAPTNTAIHALDFDANRRRRRRSSGSSRPRPGDDDFDFMGRVAEEIIERDRIRMRREVIRVLSFASAVLSWYEMHSFAGCLRSLRLITLQSVCRLNHLFFPLRRSISARPALNAIPGQHRVNLSRAGLVPRGPILRLHMRSLLASASLSPLLSPLRHRLLPGSIHIQIRSAP